MTPEQMAWADIIFVLEKGHHAKLSKRFLKYLNGKRAVCLKIPVDYIYMYSKLEKLLKVQAPQGEGLGSSAMIF